MTCFDAWAIWQTFKQREAHALHKRFTFSIHTQKLEEAQDVATARAAKSSPDNSNNGIRTEEIGPARKQPRRRLFWPRPRQHSHQSG
ncbi:DNA mismatch repair protein MutL [Trichinella pseudospiralis]